MRRVGLVWTVALLMAAAPVAAHQGVSASGPSSGVSLLLQDLQQIEDHIRRVQEWLWSLSAYTDAAREALTPVLDRVFAAENLAARLEALAAALPEKARGALRAIVARLRALPRPRSGTPRWVVERIIQADPTSETAQKAGQLDQLAVNSAIAQASARSAEEAASAIVMQVMADTSPQVDLQAGTAAAHELALRAQNTPSTRAAIQLLVEGLAAQMDQETRIGARTTIRQNAVVQQQALVSQQLAVLVDALVTTVDQQNAQQKEQLAGRAAVAVAIVETQRQTYREIAQSLLALSPARRQEAMDAFYDALTARR